MNQNQFNFEFCNIHNIIFNPFSLFYFFLLIALHTRRKFELSGSVINVIFVLNKEEIDSLNFFSVTFMYLQFLVYSEKNVQPVIRGLSTRLLAQSTICSNFFEVRSSTVNDK